MTLAYEIQGKGEPLVLIPGLVASSKDVWQGILPELAKHYQVITFDHKNTDSSCTIDSMKDDLMELISHLKLDRPHIFGHSMGSAIALSLAHKEGNSLGKLILCNTFSHLNGVAKRVFSSLIDLLASGVSAEKVLWVLAPWLFSAEFLEDPKQIEKLTRIYQKYPLSLEGLTHHFRALCQFDAGNKPKEVPCKTLVIGSENDVLIPHYEGGVIAEKLFNVCYAIIPGGHASPIENPEGVTDRVLDFLRKH